MLWTRFFHILNGKFNSNVKHHQQLGVQQYVTDRLSHTKISVSNTLHKSTSILSDQLKKGIISPTLQYRLIRPDEFTNEFEQLVFRTFIVEEPMDKHFGITEPDECNMLFLRQVLQRAKEDRVSLGIYDDSNEWMQQMHKATSINRQKLSVCFVINHIETVDDPPEKNDFTMDLSKAPIESRSKYKAIVDILSKIVENFDLFKEYKARRIMQTFLAGIEPEYANQGLFTRLKIATIDLARANKCDLLYSKATSQFSTRANLRLGFHKARVIDYNTYENDQGQHPFTGMSKMHQTCTLTVKDLRI